MLVLLMASALRDQLPSIGFEQPNELAELHLSIVPRLSAGPCPESLASASSDPPTRTSRFAQYPVGPITDTAQTEWVSAGTQGESSGQTSDVRLCG